MTFTPRAAREFDRDGAKYVAQFYGDALAQEAPRVQEAVEHLQGALTALESSEARVKELADRLRQVRLMTPNEATGCWCVVSTPGEGHSDRCKALTDLFFSWEAFARSALKEAGERPSGRRA